MMHRTASITMAATRTQYGKPWLAAEPYARAIRKAKGCGAVAIVRISTMGKEQSWDGDTGIYFFPGIRLVEWDW